MDYQQTIEYLYNSLPAFHRVGGAAYKANLDNTLKLDEYFGSPHRKYHTVHIAGTNGKGSCAHMIASVLQSAGYNVGLYTSPHLVSFRERIKINGMWIPEIEVVDFVDRNRDILEEIQPSFFEMSVAMALDYFARRQVDVAIIETGMGGRLDSTNIIRPLVSVITNIGYDHMKFLGDSLSQIAQEKAGIIKAGVPVVIGEEQAETTAVFQAKAEEMSSKIVFADKKFKVVETELGEATQNIVVEERKTRTRMDITIDLMGEYQQKNLVTVLTALDVLKLQGIVSVTWSDMEQGLLLASRQTGLKGRWQIVGSKPLVVCDTGHNESGFAEILRQIKSTPHKKLYMVLGFADDKEVDAILSILPRKPYYFFTRASIPRAMDETLLLEKAQEKGLRGQAVDTVENAYAKALAKAEMDDMIYIGGSTFIVADLLSMFEK